MPANDAFTGVGIREWNSDMTIGAPRTQKSCVESLGKITCSYDYDTFSLFDSIETFEKAGDDRNVILRVIAPKTLPCRRSNLPHQ